MITITEGIPATDMVWAWRYLSDRGSRMIGPNCPGIITPGQCKIGIMPGHIHKPGRIGVVSRSGTLTYEAVGQLTALGLGQSTCVSIGGDAIIGSTYAELMPLFEADSETRAIAIYSEPGGRMEAELADWIREHDSRLPIVAFMAGRFMDEMQGMRFGHAGTIVSGRRDTTAEKIASMPAAGISLAERIEEIPELLRQRLGERKH